MLFMIITKSDAYKAKQECTKPIRVSLYTGTLVKIWGVVQNGKQNDGETIILPPVYGGDSSVRGFLCTIIPSEYTMCLEDFMSDRENYLLYDPSNSEFVFDKYDLYASNRQLYRFVSFNGGTNFNLNVIPLTM